MKIEILGAGCANCIKLEQHVRQALMETGKKAEVEKVTEIKNIMSYGVMSTPAIAIDGKVVSYGRVNSINEIKKMLE